MFKKLIICYFFLFGFLFFSARVVNADTYQNFSCSRSSQTAGAAGVNYTFSYRMPSATWTPPYYIFDLSTSDLWLRNGGSYVTLQENMNPASWLDGEYGYYLSDSFLTLWGTGSQIFTSNDTVTVRIYSVTNASVPGANTVTVRSTHGSGATIDQGTCTFNTEGPPIMQTSSASNITSSSVRLNGTVSNVGYPGSLSEHGFVYSTSQNPTTSSTKVNLGVKATTGSINTDITGLPYGTTYYVRSYAINSNYSTVYGTQVSFTTSTPSYTVSYNTNGATSGSAPDNQSKTQDIALTIADEPESMVRTGYTFSHWNTEANGSGTTYYPGDSYATNAALTLYAQWTINTYTLHYGAGDHGSVTGDLAQSRNYGSDGSAVEAVAEEHYYFVKWSDDVTDNPRTDLNIADNIDVDAIFALYPTATAPEVTVTNDSVTINWTSNLPTESKVVYGHTNAFGTETEELDLVEDHEVELSGLRSCSKYFFQAISTDEHDTVITSSTTEFFTAGCGVSEPVTSSSSADYLYAHDLSIHTDNGTARVVAQEGFYPSRQTIIQIIKLNQNSVENIPSDKGLVEDNYFNLLAITDEGEPVTEFTEPVTFTITYSDSVLDQYQENTLDVYKYVDDSWQDKDCTLDTTANTLTCSLSGFSVYAVIGELKPATQNNTTISNSGSSSNHSSSASDTSHFCSDMPPTAVPDLFQVDVTLNTAKLYFTPIDTDTFYISFSENLNAEEHGTQVSLARDGVQSFTVNFLKPNTIYYFKVRGQSGCAPGNWSNTMQIKTNSRIYYKNFSSQNAVFLQQRAVHNDSNGSYLSNENLSAVPQADQTITSTPSQTSQENVEQTHSKPETQKDEKCFLWWCW